MPVETEAEDDIPGDVDFHRQSSTYGEGISGLSESAVVGCQPSTHSWGTHGGAHSGPGLKDAEVVVWMGDFNYRCELCKLEMSSSAHVSFPVFEHS